MARRSKIALGVFLLFYVVFGVLITYQQERIVYQPFPQDFESCEGFAAAKKITHGKTRMYVKDDPDGMVVLYHGNGGSACDRAFLADEIAQAGLGYVVPEYTGYSNDAATPSHVGVQENVRDVIDYLHTYATGTIMIIGESVGTGLAAYHTSLVKPERLLLIAPFYDILDVAKKRFWFYPTKLLVNNAFKNHELLSDANIPITIVHGNDDTLINPSSSKKLFDTLKTTDKQYVTVPNVGHNDIFGAVRTFEVLHDFLQHKETKETRNSRIEQHLNSQTTTLENNETTTTTEESFDTFIKNAEIKKFGQKITQTLEDGSFDFSVTQYPLSLGTSWETVPTEDLYFANTRKSLVIVMDAKQYFFTLPGRELEVKIENEEFPPAQYDREVEKQEGWNAENTHHSNLSIYPSLGDHPLYSDIGGVRYMNGKIQVYIRTYLFQGTQYSDDAVPRAYTSTRLFISDPIPVSDLFEKYKVD